MTIGLSWECTVMKIRIQTNTNKARGQTNRILILMDFGCASLLQKSWSSPQTATKKLLDHIIFILWKLCDGVARVEKQVFFSVQSRLFSFWGCFTKNINLTIRNCDRKKIEKCVLISMLQYSWVSCSGLSNVYIDKNIYI